MSKIKELIKEMCPNGVEYKLLKDVSEMKRGQSITTKELSEGKIPVIAGGQEPSFYNDKHNREGETITVSSSGAYAGFLNYWNEPILCTDSFSIKTKTLNIRYLYHYLKMKQQEIYNRKKGAGIPHVHISDLEKMKIPCPPIEVQEEIVRILDKFCELETKLEVELEAELEVRCNQYEFWHEQIFNNDMNLMTIGELLTAKGYIRGPFGSALVKSDMIPEGIPVYEQQHAIYNHRNFRYFITEEKARKLDRFSVEEDDLIISCSGTVGKVSVICKNDPKGVINQALLILRLDKSIILPKYMKYYLESPVGYRSITSNTNKSAQVNIASRDAIEKISIPIPTIEIQENIINKLDLFDKLVNDISESLPVEIELRRKQYEYYRNKLLSFEEI